MFEKIKAALLVKAKDSGFDVKFIDAMATYLATTVTDENQVQAAVDAFEPLLKANQGEVDRRVEKAGDKAGKGGQLGGNSQPGGGNPEPKKEQTDEQMPAWFKSYAEKVDGLVAGKSAETRQGKLNTALEGVSEAFRNATLKQFGYMSFPDEATFDKFLGEVKEDAKAFVQGEADRKLGGQGKPAQPTGGSGGEVKVATKEELDKAMAAL